MTESNMAWYTLLFTCKYWSLSFHLVWTGRNQAYLLFCSQPGLEEAKHLLPMPIFLAEMVVCLHEFPPEKAT
jgi:hypothetical protein